MVLEAHHSLPASALLTAFAALLHPVQLPRLRLCDTSERMARRSTCVGSCRSLVADRRALCPFLGVPRRVRVGLRRHYDAGRCVVALLQHAGPPLSAAVRPLAGQPDSGHQGRSMAVGMMADSPCKLCRLVRLTAEARLGGRGRYLPPASVLARSALLCFRRKPGSLLTTATARSGHTALPPSVSDGLVGCPAVDRAPETVGAPPAVAVGTQGACVALLFLRPLPPRPDVHLPLNVWGKEEAAGTGACMSM